MKTKIVKKKVFADPISFITVNNDYPVTITNQMGPVFILEDNTILVFSDAAIFLEQSIGGGVNEDSVDFSIMGLKLPHRNDDIQNDLYYMDKELVDVTIYKEDDKHVIYRLTAIEG